MKELRGIVHRLQERYEKKSGARGQADKQTSGSPWAEMRVVGRSRFGTC